MLSHPDPRKPGHEVIFSGKPIRFDHLDIRLMMSKLTNTSKRKKSKRS